MERRKPRGGPFDSAQGKLSGSRYKILRGAEAWQ
jgi:hypothetical protein